MSVRTQLREALFQTYMQLPPAAWPDDDANLIELGLDSMRVMRLLVFIEERLGVTLPDHEITSESIGSVRALVRLIEQHRPAR
jgi:acyl carrier protein